MQSDRSLVKAAKVVWAWAERLFRALPDPRRLETLVTDLIAAIQRTRRQTRHRKQAGTCQLLIEGVTPTSFSGGIEALPDRFSRFSGAMPQTLH